MIMPTGHLQDPPLKGRGQQLHNLIGTTTVPVRAWSNRHLCAAGYNQPFNNCLGAAFSHAAIAAARRQGVGIDPSKVAPYTIGRQLEAPGVKKLPDVGAYPHRVLEGLETYGFVSNARWNEKQGASDPVAQDVFEAGSLAKLTGTYRISEHPSNRSAQIRAAVYAGNFVVFGMPVGEVFMTGIESLYVGEGRYIGGHAMCIVGYQPGRYEVLNSWGSNWCDKGFGYVQDTYLNEQAFDMTVVTIAPSKVY